MSDLDRWFDQQISEIELDFKHAANGAAEALAREVKSQIRRNFNNPSAAFVAGVKVYEFDAAAVVRLSPILSSHAQPATSKGNPNIWILLPDGERLGFKRMNGAYWRSFQAKYKRSISFVDLGSGSVVLFKKGSQVVPIYKIQNSVDRKQRIDLDGAAQKVAREFGFEEF